MTEKEFRKLVTDLEMPRAFKDEVTKNLELIKENIPSMLKEAVLLDICKIGSIARSTMLNTEDSVDLMVVYKYSSSKSIKKGENSFIKSVNLFSSTVILSK